MSIFDYDLVGVIQHKSSNGQCTNPLIRFDLIRGLAVGFVIAYRLLEQVIKDLQRVESLSISTNHETMA